MLAFDPLHPDTPLQSLAQHGGRLSRARAAFPEAPEPWIDLSTGINPHTYPLGDIPEDAWRRLPDPEHEAGLIAAARACYGVPVEAGVVAAPGTQALIQVLPRVRPSHHVAVWGFGYQEHPETWRRSGASVTVTEDLEALGTADVAVVISPNNPDGRHLSPEQLAALARDIRRSGGLLVIDEAFADSQAVATSFVPCLADTQVVVLRSFGKFFGLAGLRLGFMIGDAELCISARKALGPWAVSGPALAIGSRALADTAWQKAMRERLARDAERLDGLLNRSGFMLMGGTSLFRLVRHADAPSMFTRLGRSGILVRPFQHEPSWLRFGLPADEPDWLRLAEGLGVSRPIANGS